ncbi:MAG: enoyl-CoA hydratase/isomerase family protein, partial [Pseudorhodobacter sp.]
NGADKRRFVETCWRALDDLARLPVATVAAMEGYALGGGLELALACDLRFADPDVILGFPEMVLGSVASFGAVQRLPAMVGTGRARDLLFRGHRIGASEAERIGLVSQVTEPGMVMKEAMTLAKEMSARPREAIRYLKHALSGGDSRGAAELHGLISDLCHSEPDYQARISGFTQSGPASGGE